MNAYDKQEINERLDLAISMVESYNRDISSMVSGDLYAYISDNLDGVDVANACYYLKKRYAGSDEVITDIEDNIENVATESKGRARNIINELELMDCSNIYDVPMVDIKKVYAGYEVEQVTTDDIIEYLESCKY